MRNLLVELLNLVFVVVFIWALLSWFPLSPGSPVAKVKSGIDKVLQPVFAPLRRFIPPIRLGGTYVDITPMIFIFGLRILLSVIIGL